MRNRFIVVPLLAFAAGSSACVTHYDPNPAASSIGPGTVPDFTSPRAISLRNAQTSSEDVSIGSLRGNQWVGDLNQWTNAVMAHVTSALAERNVEVADGVEREIRLSVTEAKLIFGAAVSRCMLNLRVETSDGYVRDFEVENAATAGVVYLPKVAIDGAAMRAAVAMLNDEDIIRFISE